MNLKGTETEKNLLAAFARETQARHWYDFFGKKATKEKMMEIAAIFIETGQHRTAFASRFFKLLQGGEVAMEGTFPAGGNLSILENLRSAAQREKIQGEEIYPLYAQTAKKEELTTPAARFDGAANASNHHALRFTLLADRMETGTLFSRIQETTWHCRKCGFLHKGLNAPKVCPACAHPQGYFEAYTMNW
ncbi:rubrerythrin family protein [Magnetococcales bacterium HHB-1]